MASKKGVIYILTNESMQGLVKIGFTSRSPRQRANELSSVTGVPTPFIVYASFRVPKNLLPLIERQIHNSLSRYRVNSKREFFKISPEMAKKKVKRHFANQKGKKRAKLLLFISIACFVVIYTLIQKNGGIPPLPFLL